MRDDVIKLTQELVKVPLVKGRGRMKEVIKGYFCNILLFKNGSPFWVLKNTLNKIIGQFLLYTFYLIFGGKKLREGILHKGFLLGTSDVTEIPFVRFIFNGEENFFHFPFSIARAPGPVNTKYPYFP